LKAAAGSSGFSLLPRKKMLSLAASSPFRESAITSQLAFIAV